MSDTPFAPTPTSYAKKKAKPKEGLLDGALLETAWIVMAAVSSVGLFLFSILAIVEASSSYETPATAWAGLLLSPFVAVPALTIAAALRRGRQIQALLAAGAA